MEGTDFRKKGFGSSDASWIYHFALTGSLSQNALRRIAQIKGLVEGIEISVPQMRLGLDVEDRLTDCLLESDSTVKNNPIYYGAEFDNFTTYNHIDYTTSKEWIELKSTINSIEKEEESYKEQNAWHFMIKKYNGIKLPLFLYHYDTKGLSESSFNDIEEERITRMQLEEIYYAPIIIQLEKGLRELNEFWDSFDFIEMKTWSMNAQEVKEVEAMVVLNDYLRNIKDIEKQIDKTKESLLMSMEDKGIKSIKTPLFNISYTGPTKRKGSFDMKKLQIEFPDVRFDDYRKEPSPVKANIKIQLK